MMPRCEQVLKKLQRTRYGVTFNDFAPGFRLAARIHDLRSAGYDIITINERVGECSRARYLLKGVPARIVYAVSDTNLAGSCGGGSGGSSRGRTA